MPTEADLAEMLARNPGLRVASDSGHRPRQPLKVIEQPPMKPETAKALAAAMSEDELQTSIIDLAHLHGFKVAHFRSVKATRKDGTTFWQTPVQADGEGWPDLILARADPAGGLGRFLVVELKREKENPKPKQKEWLNLLILTKRVEVFCWRPSDLLSGDIEKLLR